MPHRLVFFTAFYPPFTGGYARNVQELGRRLVARGWRVTVITTNTHGGKSEENEGEINVIRWPAWNALGTYPIPKPSRLLVRSLWRLRRQRPDVISTQTRFFPTSIIGLFFGIMNGIPIIHTERGSVHTEHGNRIVRIINVMVDHTFGALLVRRARLCIGVSKPAMEFCRHLGANRLMVIPNGIDLTRYQLATTSPPSGQPLVAIFTGRLIWAKGVQHAIQGLKTLRDRGHNVVLRIAGDGVFMPELQSLVEGLKLTSDVQFLGHQSPRQIAEVLAQADIFVNPSYSEGLPTTVLEAAAAGLPIVATDIGGTKEIIEDHVSGLIVPVKDQAALEAALEHLVRDADFRRQLGQHARAVVQERFDWQQVTERYEQEFLRVAATSSS